METIQIITNNGVVPPAQHGDWCDVYCGEGTMIEAGHYAIIPLKIVTKLPEGYEAFLIPRSSTCLKYHILMANSVGLIDEAYCGDGKDGKKPDEWGFIAYATEDTFIPKNERIAQFRLFPHQPELRFEYVNELNTASRGGIGSTGRE